MTEWIFYRDEGYDAVGLAPSELAGELYFNLWAIQQEPFTRLAEGDTCYLWDRKRKELVWELRVRALLRTEYETIDDALDHLQTAYGMFPEDLNDYIWEKSPNGYLLAWAAEVVAPMSIAVPDLKPGDLGGRAGYLPLDKVPSDQRAAMDLPPIGRPTTGEVPDYYAPELNDTFLPATVGRYIPQATRSEVFARDGGRCRECGTTDGPLHFDHIYPWSKGGGNEVGNLQLLCRTHNLAKAASVPESAARPDAPVGLVEFARSMGLDPDTATAVDLVSAAAERGNGDALFKALLGDDTSDEDDLVDVLRVALDAGLKPTDEDAVWIACNVGPIDPDLAVGLAEPLLEHASVDVAAAAALACVNDPDRDLEEVKRLLERAAAAMDARIAGPAAAELAGILWDDLHVDLDEDDTEPQVPERVIGLLQRAANCPNAEVRGSAALQLGHLSAGDPVVSAGWYRRAICSPDPDVVTEAAAFLALHHVQQQQPGAAEGLARRALQSEDPAVKGRGHFVLATIGVEGAEEHLRQALDSEDEDVAELAGELADEMDQS